MSWYGRMVVDRLDRWQRAPWTMLVVALVLLGEAAVVGMIWLAHV